MIDLVRPITARDLVAVLSAVWARRLSRPVYVRHREGHAASASVGCSFRILLIEDDPGDTLMVSDALAGRGPDQVRQVAADGVETLCLPRDLHTPRPDPILLDLTMPRMGGGDLLAVLPRCCCPSR
jgi:hypothetical protein